MKRILALIAFLVIAGLGLWWFLAEPTLFSPLGESTFSRFLSNFPRPVSNKIVYGFLPYWNIASVSVQPELTHLAYFALSIGPDGQILTQVDGGAEPGYRRLQSEDFLAINNLVKNQAGRMDIVVSQFDNETIEEFLFSKEAQATFMQSIDSLLLAYPFDGLNLDFEYNGEASAQLRNNYTQFIASVRQHLNARYENVQLTVDVYPAAASKNFLWEIEKIEPEVDYIIIMAYDFHRSSSPNAGPVAPLLQKDGLWKESINAYLKDFIDKAPTHKLLLGIPFYGYEWQTTSLEPEAFTLPSSGATASYKRVQEILARSAELELTEHWDENALAPFLSYTEDGDYYLVYYEDARSIAYKLEYVNQLDLAGIAIWSLGYEGDSRDLWQVINEKLTETP